MILFMMHLQSSKNLLRPSKPMGNGMSVVYGGLGCKAQLLRLAKKKILSQDMDTHKDMSANANVYYYVHSL